MSDDYTRRRFDRVAEDVAVVRTKVESIEKSLGGVHESYASQESRLRRVERRVFGIWLIGPIALGGVAFLKTFKNWLTEV